MFGRRLGVVALALILGVVGASCKAGDNRVSIRPKVERPVVLSAIPTPPAGVPEPTKIALVAVAKGPSVSIHAAAGSTEVVRMLPNPTIEGMPLAFLAIDQQGDWLHVRMPERPNDGTGWVKASEVNTQAMPNRIVISVSQRSVRVLDKGQQVIFETNAAVGKPATPTPLGRFYVDVWLPNPGSPYGQFLLSISGFSDVLKRFAGGRGQIALHGWSDPSAMGRDVSNGCIRMRNADIIRLSELAPLGTPVEIIA